MRILVNNRNQFVAEAKKRKCEKNGERRKIYFFCKIPALQAENRVIDSVDLLSCRFFLVALSLYLHPSIPLTITYALLSILVFGIEFVFFPQFVVTRRDFVHPVNYPSQAYFAVITDT